MNVALFFLGILLLFVALAAVVYLAVRLGAVLFRALEKRPPADDERNSSTERPPERGRGPHPGG
ncbi:MAG: hypothetical protein ACP5SI_01190 [Chloroflexia bacterium]